MVIFYPRNMNQLLQVLSLMVARTSITTRCEEEEKNLKWWPPSFLHEAKDNACIWLNQQAGTELYQAKDKLC